MHRTLISLLLVVSMAGCWAPQGPHTRITVNPVTKTWTFDDTKDNDISIKGLKVDAKTGSGTLDELTIRNNASDVMRQQIELMAQWNVQMQTANEGIVKVMNGLQSMLSTIAPLAGKYIDANPSLAGAAVKIATSQPGA